MSYRTIYDVWPNADSPPSRQRATYHELRDEQFWEFYEIVKPYTMLTIAGLYNLAQSLRHIARNEIPGDFVECGVFLGGASIFICLMREALGLQDRVLHCFDSFTGFPEGSADVRLQYDGSSSRHEGAQFESIHDVVLENFRGTCDTDGVEFHVGMVEDTLPVFATRELALLRLDTDFYASTKLELEALYPMLSPGGALIVDDYGWFEGSRRATDEFLAATRPAPALNRIDEGVWAGVKPG